VRVEATTVNPADLGMRDGRYRWIEPVRFPIIPGYDVCGVVEVGTSAWPAGTRVIASTAHSRTQVGSYAELVALPESHLAHAPAGLTAQDAATLPLAGLTALQALDLLALAPGSRLIVNGPRGAVGRYATQLAALRGIEVVDDGPSDGSLDVIGGAPAQQAFASVRDGGAYVTVVPEFWVPGGQFEPARGITPQLVRAEPRGDQLEELARLMSEGRLKPTPVADTLPLDRAAEAHARLAARGVGGKLILRP
jgi:NADPH:quinone reductase